MIAWDCCGNGRGHRACDGLECDCRCHQPKLPTAEQAGLDELLEYCSHSILREA